MKDWEKYEFEIFDKLKNEFPGGEILKNQKKIGVFSKRSRQIDILVKAEMIGKEIFGVIDCKKFSKKINVKTVESFIGFLEDVGANLGVMITNVGYSKSALNRITNYTNRDIRLDIVEFNNFEDYHFYPDECSLCRDEDDFPRGFINFGETYGIIKEDKVTLIQQGHCSYCGESYLKCQGCGEIIHFENDDEVECHCENVYSVTSEYIGQGMTENVYSVRLKGEKKVEFFDPNQTTMFE
jgi:Restriction endonuclease